MEKFSQGRFNCDVDYAFLFTRFEKRTYEPFDKVNDNFYFCEFFVSF